MTARKLKISSRHLLQLAEAHASLGFWLIEVPEGHIRWSDGLYQISGRQRDGDGPAWPQILEWTHKDDHTHLRESYLQMMGGIAPPAFSFRILRADGSSRALLANFHASLNVENAPRCWIGSIVDTTDGDILRNRAQLDRARMMALLKTVRADSIWFATSDLAFMLQKELQNETLRVNPPQFQSSFGWLQFIHPDDREATRANIDTHVSDPTCSEFMIANRILCSDNEARPFRHLMTAIRDEPGRVVEWLGITHEVRRDPSKIERLTLEKIMESGLINGPVLRAARSLISWTARDLALRSGLSASTIARAEESDQPIATSVKKSTAQIITKTLLNHGVSFGNLIDEEIAVFFKPPRRG